MVCTRQQVWYGGYTMCLDLNHANEWYEDEGRFQYQLLFWIDWSLVDMRAVGPASGPACLLRLLLN